MVHFFRGFRDGGKKLLLYLVFGSVLMVSILLPVSRAAATDAWSVAAQALGVYAAYQSALRTLMAYGADPEQQVKNAWQMYRQTDWMRMRTISWQWIV